MVGKRDCYTPYDRLSPVDQGSHEQPAAAGAITAPDVDLAFPAVDIDALYSLLPDSPLFYSHGNFRKMLIQAYSQAARSIEALAVSDDDGLSSGTRRSISSMMFTVLGLSRRLTTASVFSARRST